MRPQAPSPGVHCGHPHAYLVDVDGNLEELEGPIHPPLGTGEEQPTFTASDRQLASDERLILVTDGITERRTENGGSFGIEGIRRATRLNRNQLLLDDGPGRWPGAIWGQILGTGWRFLRGTQGSPREVTGGKPNG